MAEEKTDDLESLNQEGEQDTTPDGEETEQTPEESTDEEESEEKDWRQIAENQRIRAEKAEAKLKKTPKSTPKVVSESTSELSQSDLIYLAKSDIHEDDVEEVLNIAKSQGKSLKEVHNFGWVKSFLAEKQEERKTAQATSTSSKRSGVKAVSPSQAYNTFEKTGELPDDEEGLAKLAQARFQRKKN